MICFTQLIVSFLYTVIFKEYQKSSTSFGLLHIKITLSICLLNSFFQFKSSNLVVLGLFSTKICWPCSNLLPPLHVEKFNSGISIYLFMPQEYRQIFKRNTSCNGYRPFKLYCWQIVTSFNQCVFLQISQIIVLICLPHICFQVHHRFIVMFVIRSHLYV